MALALRAAAESPARPFVRVAFAADWRLAVAPLLRAELRACRAKALRLADFLDSRFSAAETARDRRLAGFWWEPAFWRSRLACLRVLAEARPFFGGRSFTPARLAFESPIAIACFVERAPCFPSRM